MGVEMPVRRATALLLVMACGPTVVLDDGTEGDSASSDATSTGPHDPSITTSPGPVDSSSSNSTTTVDPGDTTAVDGSTGDPVEPCPPPIRGLTYLWCGDVSTRTRPTTDGAWVYFGTTDGGLWRVPAAGGDAENLAQGLGDLYDLEIVDGLVYWTSFFDGLVGSIAANGGPLRILDESLWKPSSIAVGGGYAFVTQYGDDLPLMRYDLAVDLATPLYPDLDYAGHAFVVGDSLYFATGTNDGNNPTPLVRGSFDGAPLQPVMDADGIIEDLDREDQTLWWARYRVDDSAILRTGLDEPVVTTTVLAFPRHPLSLALTPDRIYWAELEILDGNLTAYLRSMTRDGGDLLEHLASSTSIAGVVATDAGVTFSIDAAVVRLD